MYKPYNFHKVSGLVGAWALARHLLDDIPVVSQNSNDYQVGPIERELPSSASNYCNDIGSIA